jgi:hypothetical protein
MTSRLVDRLVILATTAIFRLALAVLVRGFANVSSRDVLGGLAALPVSYIQVLVRQTRVIDF